MPDGLRSTVLTALLGLVGWALYELIDAQRRIHGLEIEVEALQQGMEKLVELMLQHYQSPRLSELMQ